MKSIKTVMWSIKKKSISLLHIGPYEFAAIYPNSAGERGESFAVRYFFPPDGWHVQRRVEYPSVNEARSAATLELQKFVQLMREMIECIDADTNARRHKCGAHDD